MALMIPIITVGLLAVIAITVVVLRFLRRRRLFELYHQERMAAMEKGVEVPPLPEALLCDGARVRAPGAVLLRGLVWLFSGLALAFALHEMNLRGAPLALIPIGVGMAYLVYYAVEGRKASTALAEPPSAQPPLTAVANANS